MHSDHHIHECHVLPALWCMAGKEKKPSPVWLISPKDADNGTLERTNTQVLIKRVLGKKEPSSSSSFCFHDVVWICFSAPPRLTLGNRAAS